MGEHLAGNFVVPDNLSLLESNSTNGANLLARRTYLYTFSFLLVFISFTLGGVANVFALKKLKGVWCWCPLLCNLAFVGSFASFVSAPIFAANLVLNDILDFKSTFLCVAHNYLWAMCENPLCVSVAAISIQRSIKILSTFTPRPNKPFQLIAIAASWFSAIPELILLTINEGNRKRCFISVYEYNYLHSIDQYVSFFMVMSTIVCMLTTYSCAIWYLKYGVHRRHNNATESEMANVTRKSILSHFKASSLEESALRGSERGAKSSTTVTYMLAKQVLMISGLGASLNASNDTEKSVKTCVESFPGPSVIPKSRRLSEFRRRSSLDVSTIYSMRHSRDVQPPPMRSTKLSLPGCISPEGDDSGTFSSNVDQKWYKKVNGFATEPPRNGRISEESMVPSNLNCESPWADPITPPFDAHSVTDPFSEGIVSNGDALISSTDNNRLSPFLGQERMKIFSISSMSSDGESGSRFSSASLNSRRGSNRRGSKPLEMFLQAIRASRRNTSSSVRTRASANEETILKDTSLSKSWRGKTKQSEDEADVKKEESDNTQDPPEQHLTDKKKDKTASAGTQTLPDRLPQAQDETDERSMPQGRAALNSSSTSIKSKKAKKGKAGSKNRSVSPNKGASPQKLATAPALPPLRHERLCASGVPIAETSSKGDLPSSPVTKEERIAEEITQLQTIEQDPSRPSKEPSKSIASSKSGKSKSLKLSNGDGSVCMSVKRKSKISNITKRSSLLSMKSEMDIFQFLAEGEEKERIVKKKQSFKRQRIEKSRTHHSDPTGISFAPNRLFSKFSTPTGIFRRSYINPQHIITGKRAFHANKRSPPEKHGGAYHAARKAAWLVFYFVLTMAPLASVKMLPTNYPTLLTCVQATAYICFVINPFSYILSNKNLIVRPRVTDFRRNFIT